MQGWARHAERFPMFTNPEPSFHGVVYAKDFPDNAYVIRCRTVGMRNGGAALSPFNAFMLLQGLETLAIRCERHQANAAKVAEWLRQDRRVAWVSWLGFEDHPDHRLARELFEDRYPSILTFGVAGGYDASIGLFNRVKLFKRLVNLGDAKSLISHPASTTHRQLGPDELRRANITADMIRLSVGIEHIDDIIDDLDQALGSAA
jgi:O-acetylhomoserine (thiol)-lyase